MRLMVASDLHGDAGCCEKLMEAWEREHAQGAGRLFLLGDLLYHGPRNPLRPDYAPPRVVEQLNRCKRRITAVRGNGDSEVDQMLLEFPILSEYATLLEGGRRFFLTHGHHWNPGNPPPLERGSVLACGHTHIPELKTLENGLSSFNPGSTSLPKRGFDPSYGFYADGKLQVLSLESGEEIFSMQL